MQSMNRKLLYIGVCILLAGLVCLSVGEFFIKRIEHKEVPGTRTEREWSFTGTLNTGRIYLLYIESGDEWSKPFLEGLVTDPLPVYINVTLPDGAFAVIQALFYGEKPSSPYYQEVNLAIVDVQYTIRDPDLNVIEGSSNIRFTVKENGNYTFNVVKSTFNTPPNYMIIFEEVNVGGNLYYSLMLSGGLICTMGILVVFSGVVKKEKVKRRKKLKSG